MQLNGHLNDHPPLKCPRGFWMSPNDLYKNKKSLYGQKGSVILFGPCGCAGRSHLLHTVRPKLTSKNGGLVFTFIYGLFGTQCNTMANTHIIRSLLDRKHFMVISLYSEQSNCHGATGISEQPSISRLIDLGSLPTISTYFKVFLLYRYIVKL